MVQTCHLPKLPFSVSTTHPVIQTRDLGVVPDHSPLSLSSSTSNPSPAPLFPPPRPPLITSYLNCHPGLLTHSASNLASPALPNPHVVSVVIQSGCFLASLQSTEESLNSPQAGVPSPPLQPLPPHSPLRQSWTHASNHPWTCRPAHASKPLRRLFPAGQVPPCLPLFRHLILQSSGATSS